MKVCFDCGEKREEIEFSKDNNKKDKLGNRCKICRKRRRLENSVKIAEKKKKYYEDNKERISTQSKNYYENNKEKALKRQKQYYENNKKELLEYDKCYRKDNKIRIKERRQRHYENNKETILEHNKQYHDDNKETIAKYQARYKRERIESDPCFKIASGLRTRLYRALKGNFKSGSAVNDLGCSIPEFKMRLERQFEPGMTWENYGTHWHIDHIIPLSSFNLTDRMEFLEACNWCNLQPLWAEDNLRKSNKLFQQENE